MNVLYASDNGYADYLGISLYSLLENNIEMQEINIYIFSNAISKSNMEKLKKMTNSFGRNVFFIDISDLEKRIGFPINSCGYNITTFARLFVDELLPPEIDKILYLDSDIIVRGSLTDLWKTDVGEVYVAAAVEVYMPESKKRAIGLDEDDSYYNAGMLLINRKKWASDNLKERFLTYYKQMGGKLLYNDQDIINHCCRGYVKAVSPVYNFEPNVYYFPYNYIKSINKHYFIDGKEKYQEMLKEPIMIHFLGDERPWVKGNRNPYREVFYEYMNRSGWKNIAWIEGKEFYMFLYHCLNVSTKIFPPFRTFMTNIVGINKFKWFGKK